MTPQIPPQRLELSSVPVARCEHRPAWASATSVTLQRGSVVVVVQLTACSRCADPLLGVADSDTDDAPVSWYELRGLPDVERVGE